MSFHDAYHLDASFDDCFVSEIEKIGKNVEVPSGVYSDAIFVVLDADNNLDVSLSNWFWLLPLDSRAIAYTCVGDFFVWSKALGSIFFIDVQYGTREFIDSDLVWFLNNFLPEEEIIDSVLKAKKCLVLKKEISVLNYGQCYILEPWACLGGDDLVENYVVGSFAIYIDLVGQMHLQLKRKD
jgi:hypothetical protein